MERFAPLRRKYTTGEIQSMSDAVRAPGRSSRFAPRQFLLAVMFCALLLGLAAVVCKSSVHSNVVLMQWLLFSPDGQTLATGLDGLDNHSIQVWDVPRRTQIAELAVEAAEETLILSPAAGTVSLPSKDELVTLDYPEEGMNRWVLPRQGQRTAEASSGLLSPDGNWLLMDRPDGAVEVHAVGAERAPVQLALRDSEALCQMYFAADGKTLVVWHWDGTIDTYDLLIGKHRRSVQVEGGFPGVLAPDLHWAASCEVDSGIVHVYRMDDGAQWLTISEENDYTPPMAFSHDSRRLAVGDDGGTVTLWDLASRRPQASASGPGRALALAFSPDGASLAVAHAHRHRWFRRTPIRLVDPVTLDEQAVLGERNYRPQMALLLAGFIIWLVFWRWTKRRQSPAGQEQPSVESLEVSEVLLHENVPAAKVGRLWVGHEPGQYRQ
jgi:hypothetical protein